MKVIHPKSRKAEQFRKRLHHEIRTLKKRKQHSHKDKLLEQKLKWFKENFPVGRTHLSHIEQAELIERYLRRSKGNVPDASQPISVTVDMANAFNRQEYEEYATCGIRVPDLTSKVNVQKLLLWENDHTQIPAIALKTIKRSKK
ncbi:unnamed protein product [Dicrocoelium dendriticum]|nr:unnamed protein product [Dicrocoelium dendriticum]